MASLVHSRLCLFGVVKKVAHSEQAAESMIVMAHGHQLSRGLGFDLRFGRHLSFRFLEAHAWLVFSMSKRPCYTSPTLYYETHAVTDVALSEFSVAW